MVCQILSIEFQVFANFLTEDSGKYLAQYFPLIQMRHGCWPPEIS